MAESSSTSLYRQTRRNSMDRPPIYLRSSSGALSDELQCSICLDVFSDPVSTPCGHNFCKPCLKQCWDTTQNYHCPLCKETFRKRPDLKINTALREIVQLFKERSGQKKSEVLCDFCDDEKLKALKSCLVCQISYCETHLEPHHRVPNLKKHKLIDPVENPEDFICQKHEKPLELYCRYDQTCVCMLCVVTDHSNHNTVTVEEESGKRKPQLKKIQTDVKQKIRDRMKIIQDIKHSAELRKHSEKEKSESVELFSALIRSIERCQTEWLEMMEQKQKAAEKHNVDLIKDLELEISELKWRDSELEKLLHTEDHLHLLQFYPSVCKPVNIKNCPEISDTEIQLSVEPLVKALTELQKTLDEKLTETVLKRVQLYAVDLTLDPDTAYPHLILSDDGKQVRHVDIKLKLPDNPERFDYCTCVLAKEGFSTGRFYFEVQVKEKTDWDLGVARESIYRKGQIILSPEDGYWTVVLRNENQYKAREASSSLSLSLRIKPEVVGVFVDYEVGLVSFYNVKSRSHIYSFTGQTFTEKLYPYFSPDNNNDGKNAAPLIISQVKLLK